MQKVYVDASYLYNTKKCTAGFYNQDTGQKLISPLNVRDSYRGETLACLLALRHYDDKAIIHTDCQGAFEFIQIKYPYYSDNIKWISRKFNKVADKLSRLTEDLDVKTPVKIPDHRTYILNQDYKKKINLYRNLATEKWQFDFVDALEKHYEIVKKNPLSTFKYKGKFHSNGVWISLIWQTNDHKSAGRNFFKFMKTRGQVMDKQNTSSEFIVLLNTLKNSRKLYDRNNRSTNGETVQKI